MINFFQQAWGKMVAMVSVLAISLGIATTPANLTSNKIESIVVDSSSSGQLIGTPESPPTLVVATPTSTPTPTPQTDLCEAQIREKLPEVENAYLKAQQEVKDRWEIEHCDPYRRPSGWPPPSQEDIKECEQHNRNVEQRGKDIVNGKIAKYKEQLTSCTGREVKFSEYSSKIPTEY